ncbi:MAG: hypothetical protein E7564_01950 [Ruminococcaceae bacterium]|nr:hypothetical protein [Oscillospiraceae bacterium]
MKKRVYIICAVFTALLFYSINVLYSVSQNELYVETAHSQQKRKITLHTSRGTIYDRNLTPLTNSAESICIYAIVPPEISILIKMKDNFKEDIDIEKAVAEGKPLLIPVKEVIDTENVSYINLSDRYSANQPASNILGYLSDNSPVSGIEKYADGILKSFESSLSVVYTADSLGRMIVGEEYEIINNSDISSDGGVVLTLDKELQKFCEEEGKYIENGAIVVLSVPDAEILAAVSYPLFDSSCPENFLETENSPFINKCFSSFAPGSVFKLVLTAAALNENYDTLNIYNCNGTTYSDNMAFSCYGSIPHGQVNLNLALGKSCNCYFMNLSKRLSIRSMLTSAYNFGLGTSQEVFEGLFTESGNIPDENSLNNNRALSNFAIGQGEVTVTPIQVAAMLNTVASRGTYAEPSLYEGKTHDGKEIREKAEPKSVKAFKYTDMLLTENYMETAVKYGTASKGGSSLYRAFAKTGTAQTGVFENGKELLNYWYAGFIETENNERYVIVVLSANETEGNNKTGEIFKKISEYIALDF